MREARRLLPDLHAADDVVQEALLRAWRGVAAGARPEAPLAWMTTITRNEAARWHTSREARIWAATGDPAALQAHTVDAAESSRDIERLLDYLAVMSAVAQLSDPDQRLLALRYGEDLTYSEVATRLGTAEGTAKVRLHRLRRRLRVALEP